MKKALGALTTVEDFGWDTDNTIALNGNVRTHLPMCFSAEETFLSTIGSNDHWFSETIGIVGNERAK